MPGHRASGRCRLHGGVLLRQCHQDLGGGAHRQGPRLRARGSPRAGGRGHHRQRPDLELPAALPHAAPAEERRDLRPPGQGGRAAGRPRPALRRVHHPARVRRRLRARCGRALPQPARRPSCTREQKRERRRRTGAGRRVRDPHRHRGGPRARRPGGDARTRGLHVRGAVLGAARRPGPPPGGHLRRRARRDGDGARHPVRLALRAPPGALPRQGARGVHPGRGRTHHRACPSWPASSTATPAGCRCKSA